MQAGDFYIIFNGRMAVDRELFDKVRKTVSTRIDTLAQGTYTAAQLCGKKLWNRLSDGERRAAGGCIASLAKHHDLPLVDEGRNSSNAKIYGIQL